MNSPLLALPAPSRERDLERLNEQERRMSRAFEINCKVQAELDLRIIRYRLRNLGGQARTITWITDGTLPPFRWSEVIVCDLDGNVSMGFYALDTWHAFVGDEFIGMKDIKAWAQLPEGPKL